MLSTVPIQCNLLHHLLHRCSTGVVNGVVKIKIANIGT